MSKHRVKSVGVDYEYDDAYDDYDENEGEDSGLTEEDKEQLRIGTIKVRAELGSDLKISDEEIHDSLWHYYYDVAKTVTYIKNKRKPSTPKAKPKSDIMPINMNEILYCASSLSNTDHSANKLSLPAKDFFADCPWLNIRKDRLADIMVESRYPRLGTGLRGGASGTPTGGISKVSKVAAIAAARRKRENETPNDSSGRAGLAGLKKPRGHRKNSMPKSLKPNEFQQQPPSVRTSASSLENQMASSSFAVGLGADTIDHAVVDDFSRLSVEIPAPKAEEQEVKEADEKGTNYDAFQHIAEPSAFGATMCDPYDYSRDPGYATEPMFGVEPSTYSFTNTNFDTPSEPAYDMIFGIPGKTADLTGFAGPSPDSVIANARDPKASKDRKKNHSPPTGDSKTGSKPKPVDSPLADSAEKLSINSVKVKSKNLDVPSEYKNTRQKNAANFVVIGHVDAGKSTLMGRLLLELNAVNQRTIEKYRKEADSIGKGSFALAWVLDEGTEERSKGVTIDIAERKFETEKTNFTILDAPGHKDFVPNMIVGASQADFAVLVIDASRGNFESGLKGQTREHALLVRSMGVQKIIVAVNKMDSAKWSHERFEEIRQQMASFLKTAGFQDNNVSFIPCSGLRGENITRKVSGPESNWYEGNTLVEELDTSEPMVRTLEKPLRMTVSDVFRGSVNNPLSISGRIDAGTLQVGDQIGVMPSAEKATIRTLEVDNETADWAVAGQNVILNLTDIDPIHIKPGDVVCSPASPIASISTLTVKVLAFQHLMPSYVEVMKGRLQVAGRISQLVSMLDKATGKVVKKKPRVGQPGSIVRIVVELDNPVPLEAPGRIVLRANGETLAAGILE